MADMRKSAVVLTMFIFLLIAFLVVMDAYHYVYQNQFCQICHEREFDSYDSPGDSVDFAHSQYQVSCAGCHEGNDRFAFLTSMAKMILLDVTGSSSPPRSRGEVSLENKERCLVCHDNYRILLSNRVLNPHVEVTDCSTCHSGHTRGMEDKTCSTCHPVQYTILEQDGARHSKKGCNFCHSSHTYIMECTQCHGSFHQGISVYCDKCHTDAHKPTHIEFTSAVLNRTLCLKCHASVNIIFTVNPSNHSNLDCMMCHPSHGEKEHCSKCHEPHGEESTRADCPVCHTGHTPHIVTYSGTTPSSLCLECHEEAGNRILDSNTRHARMECVQCHPDHALIPRCIDCHGTPHISTPTDCDRCHISAHELRGI